MVDFISTMDGGVANLADDGGSTGRGSCQTPLTPEVSGLMKCQDRDRVQVEVDATWHVGQAIPGSASEEVGPQCSLPTGCNFHGFITLHQCGVCRLFK